MKEQQSGTHDRWCVPEPDDLAWTSWDGEFVAYHRPSGKTHFLNASSHYLLADLLREPRSARDVARAFAAAGAATNADEAADEITAMLEHFEHLGLIERA